MRNTLQLYREEDYLGNQLILIFNGTKLDNSLINDMVVDMGESIYHMNGDYLNNPYSKRIRDITIEYTKNSDIIERCTVCGRPIYEDDMIDNTSSYMCAYCNSIFEI